MSQRKYTKTLNFCIRVVIWCLLQAALQRLTVSPPVTRGDAGVLVHSAGSRDCWWGSDLLCKVCRDLSYKALVLKCWRFPTAVTSVICLSVDGEEQEWIMWILFEDRDHSQPEKQESKGSGCFQPASFQGGNTDSVLMQVTLAQWLWNKMLRYLTS